MWICLLHTQFKFINIYVLLKKFCSAYRQFCLGHSMVLVPHPDTRQLLGQTGNLVTELLKNIKGFTYLFLKLTNCIHQIQWSLWVIKVLGSRHMWMGIRDLGLNLDFYFRLSGLSITIMTPTSTLQSTPSRELISSPTVFTLPSSWEISLKKVHAIIYFQI